MSVRYEYPRPALTADVVAWRLREDRIEVALIRRARPPFAGRWALPGGFVDPGEAPERAAVRELAEETGLRVRSPRLLCVRGRPDRDPREPVVSVVQIGELGANSRPGRAGDDAAALEFFPLHAPPRLAFDHRAVLTEAAAWLRERARRRPVGLDALPKTFTEADLRRLHRALREGGAPPRGLAGRLRELGLIVGPPEANRFDRRVARSLERDGFPFLL
ncbi:MAG: NUDIX hydrolase [Planctomycetota bacterium]